MNVSEITDKIQNLYKQEIQFQKSLSNFSALKSDNFIGVIVHYNQQKRGGQLLMKGLSGLFVVIIPFLTYSNLYILFLLEIWGFLWGITMYKMHTRICFKIRIYNNGEILIIKQGPVFKKVIKTVFHPSILLIAKHRTWVGNRYFGKNSDNYELIFQFIKEGGTVGEISSIYDNNILNGGNINIKGVLKEKELLEIAKELRLPFQKLSS